MVKAKSISDRLFLSGKEKKDMALKIKHLTDSCNLPANLGELFLIEIRLSTDEANSRLREKAKLLGLI